MRLCRSVAFLIVVAVVAASAASAQTAHEYVPGEMLVTALEGFTESILRATLGGAGHTVLKRFQLRSNPVSGLNRLYHVRARPGEDLDAALESVRQMPGVEAAQRNYIHRALAAPNDPYYYLQWGLENTGDDSAHTVFGLHGPDPRVSDTDIDYEEASDLWSGMPFDTVVVGIIDSGIDLDHPDLTAVLWTNPGEIPGNGQDDDGNGAVDDVHGWDFYSNDNDPDDEEGHGTHVAGAVVSATSDGTGVAGTAPNAALMALRFLGQNGGTTADAIAAIVYGIDNGAQILTAAWGGGGYEQALADAIQEARNAGVLFVAAAGNETTDTDRTPHYPSSYDADNIVSVAAASPWRDLFDSSNRGLVTVDIAAPGQEIISTTPTDGGAGLPETAYQLAWVEDPYPAPIGWSGTSCATSFVSGAAAILYGLGDSLWPDWSTMTPVDRMTAVRDRILTRAERWPAFSGVSVTDGHLNLGNLLEDDATPPDPVGASLEVVATGPAFITLRWMATGDDGPAGSANYSDLRYQPGSTLDYVNAARARGVWTPGPSGSIETFTLTGLLPATDYAIGIEVVDNVGNRSGVTEITSTTRPASGTVHFLDDMESGTGGWTATGDWALTTEAANSPVHSWTDSPGVQYGNNQDVSLTSPEIVTDGAAATLTYIQRYELEDGYDLGYVEARWFDGSWGPWTTVDTFTGTDLAWHEVAVELPVIGDRVQVRFRLVSDVSEPRDGWHVDDVNVHTPVGLVLTPVFEETFDSCGSWNLSGDWACSSGSLSDSPGGDYPLNNRASATLGGFLNLEGTQAVEVSFDFVSFDYEQDYDFLLFQYSLDGTSWRTIDRYTGSSTGTRSYRVDALAGMPSVYFRFMSLTDYGVSDAGAAIDNFRVQIAEVVTCAGDSDCDDGTTCTIDTCDSVAGCTHEPDPSCPDLDGDGTDDSADNCVLVPNGPFQGTCVAGLVGTPCTSTGECTGPGPGLCSVSQEDLDGDGTGDACDPDQDGDGVDAAAGDCDDRSAQRYPGAIELCDGIDNDCDDVIDNVIPPAEVSGLRHDGVNLHWDPVVGATDYDVVIGDLGALSEQGMASAVIGCMVDDQLATSIATQDVPQTGAGHWYLVRSGNCVGPGTYGEAAASLQQTRDEAIADSNLGCP